MTAPVVVSASGQPDTGSGPYTSNSVTTTQANERLFGVLGFDENTSGHNPAATSPSTLIQSQPVGASNFGIACSDRNAATVGSYTIGFTDPSSVFTYAGSFIVRVQGSSGVGVSTKKAGTSASPSITLTAGSTVVIGVTALNGGTLNVPTSSKGDTFTKVGSTLTTAEGQDIAIYKCEGVVGGATTFTNHFTGSYPAMVVAEYLAPSTGRSASAALTDSADSLTSAGTVSLDGSASLSDGSDALTASGTVSISASAALTDSGDSLSATAQTGSEASASASLTDSPDTLTAAGTVSLEASLSGTDASDSLTAAAGVLVQATASLTDAGDSLTATGSAATPGAPALGAHTMLKVEDYAGSNPETTSAIDTQASGSSFLVLRGGESSVTSTPTDNKSNTWSALGSAEVYDGYSGEFDVRAWTAIGGAGGTGHTVSLDTSAAPTREITIPFIEVKNANQLEDSSITYPHPGTDTGTVTTGTVTTSGAATLIRCGGAIQEGLTRAPYPTAGSRCSTRS